MLWGGNKIWGIILNMEALSGLKKLVFVTSNLGKFAEAEKVAQQYDIVLRMKTLELVEIQNNNPQAVVQAKAKAAYQELKCPLVVHDSSWAIPALNGFPGAYMHDVANWFAPEDWLSLMHEHLDRAIEVSENVTYYDGNMLKTFQHCQRGYFVNVPRGRSGNSLDKVVTMAAGKTIAECHDANIKSNSVALRVWEEFFDWYMKKEEN